MRKRVVLIGIRAGCLVRFARDVPSLPRGQAGGVVRLRCRWLALLSTGPLCAALSYCSYLAARHSLTVYG